MKPPCRRVSFSLLLAAALAPLGCTATPRFRGSTYLSQRSIGWGPSTGVGQLSTHLSGTALRIRSPARYGLSRRPVQFLAPSLARARSDRAERERELDIADQIERKMVSEVRANIGGEGRATAGGEVRARPVASALPGSARPQPRADPVGSVRVYHLPPAPRSEPQTAELEPPAAEPEPVARATRVVGSGVQEYSVPSGRSSAP